MKSISGELNPYGGPPNFNAVLRRLGIDPNDFEAAASSSGWKITNETEDDEGEDEIDLRPRRSRRAFGLPEKKTLDQRL